MRHRGRADKGRPSPWNLLATEEPTDIRSFFLSCFRTGQGFLCFPSLNRSYHKGLSFASVLWYIVKILFECVLCRDKSAHYWADFFNFTHSEGRIAAVKAFRFSFRETCKCALTVLRWLLRLSPKGALIHPLKGMCALSEGMKKQRSSMSVRKWQNAPQGLLRFEFQLCWKLKCLSAHLRWGARKDQSP